MERRPGHLVRCAGLLLLLAGVGAQKKLLEKVLKKTTTLKPRLLQTSDGKHSDFSLSITSYDRKLFSGKVADCSLVNRRECWFASIG